MKKIKLDPDKIEYDGKGFKKVVKNEDDFWNRLKDIQNEIDTDIFNKKKITRLEEENLKLKEENENLAHELETTTLEHESVYKMNKQYVENSKLKINQLREENLKLVDVIEKLYGIIWDNTIITPNILQDAMEIYNEAEIRTFSEELK